RCIGNVAAIFIAEGWSNRNVGCLSYAGEFRTLVDILYQLVPEMQMSTAIICGFPGETDDDFAQTLDLIRNYKFSQEHIS
ncbi:hypothetical protein GIB67_022079, partial [Kingdonia uniflora]